MLSISAKYAIRAVVFLMSKSEDNLKRGIRSIAEEIEANEHTTGKILQTLAREGIISSTKGPSGGFFMKKERPVYLIDIVKLIDGESFFRECGLGLKVCSDKKPCPIHDQYKKLRESYHHSFCTITIQQLSADLLKGKAFLKQ